MTARRKPTDKKKPTASGTRGRSGGTAAPRGPQPGRSPKPKPKQSGETDSLLSPDSAGPDTGGLPSLDACRREIDRTDEALIELLDRRARIARRVGELKAVQGGPFFDAGRHLQLLSGIGRRGQGDFPREGLRIVYGEILSACLNLQSPQTIAFLGPEATFTHIAAQRAFGRSALFTPHETIGDIFTAVRKSRAHFGVVPVENSTGGVIHATLDELMNTDLQVCAEIFTPIRHNLLCLGARSRIRLVATHPQILSQCRGWLRENLPGVELLEVASSAEGARLAQKSRTTATIGSKIAGELYKLPVLEEGIEDQKDNVTRFLVIGSQSPRPSGSDRTSVMFSIKDQPGALYQLLKPFAERRINMTKIESRPTRRRAWDYIFFVDMEGHISDPVIRDTIEEMKEFCTWLRILGSYPVDRMGDRTGSR